MLTHGSLFTGIGGFDLGLEWAGIKTIWQVEIDEYCRRLLEKRFPSARRYADIRAFAVADAAELQRNEGEHHARKLGGAESVSELGNGCGPSSLRVDIISGGFPCQPVSHAGKRQGAADARYLWPEMFRVIRTLRPSWVVAENVYGLITHGGGELLDKVYDDLEGEGYETLPPIVLPACAFGAPHRRDRVWVVAHRGHNRRSAEPEQQQEEWAEGTDRSGKEQSSDAADVAYRPGARCDRTARKEQHIQRQPLLSSRSIDGGDVAHCEQPGLERLCGNGEARNEPRRLNQDANGPTCKGGLRDTAKHRLEAGRQAARTEPRRPDHSDWWTTEPAVGGTFDGLSRWLDGYGGINGVSQVEFAPEAVCVLWNIVLTQELRVPQGISHEKVLLAFLCKLKGWKVDEARIQLASQEALEAQLRGVRGNPEAYCPSCRSGQVKQHASEHPDFVQVVSRFLARHAGKAWTAYRRSDACPTLGWEDGYARVMQGVPKRVDRLRGLGNAIVPQIAYLIGRLIVEMEVSCQPQS